MFGSDNSVWNEGTIQGGDGATDDADGGAGIEILADSTVDDITNLGLLLGGVGNRPNQIGSGLSGYGIHNYGGTLTKLTNAQGGISGGGTGAGLTYSGDLPDLYEIVLYSPTNYGELNVTYGLGTNQMTVGVSDLSTDFSDNLYASVITGVTADQMTNEEDAFVIADGVMGRITNASATIWDLRVWHMSEDFSAIAEPQHYVFERKSADQRNALHYDCTMFAVNGSCVAGTLRQASTGAAYGTGGGVAQVSGTVAGAISLDPTLRIGGFLEFGGTPDTAEGVTFTTHAPMIGGFVGFGGAPDGTGLQGRVAATYQYQEADIVRIDALSSDGYARGSASFHSSGVMAEVNFGQNIGAGTTISPYVGLVATQSRRAAYEESRGGAPLNFAPFTETQVTGTAGLRVNGVLAPQVTYRIGAGLEQDISHTLSSFDVSGSGVDASYQSAYTPSATRFTGQVGMSYLIGANKALTIDGQVNQFGEDGTDYAVTVGCRIGY